MIRLESVSKRYGNLKAVDDLSFEIHPGQITGFLGPNGAGKTTTMRMITHYLRPTSGRIEIKGRGWEDRTHQLGRIIGYLPESNPLYAEFSVYDMLETAGRLKGLSAGSLSRGIGRMIEVCGLGQQLKQTIASLSKGYRQRVGLAIALINDPEILILDEPTNGLDPNQISDILTLIRELGREKTVLLSTHILGHTTQTCDRLLIIAQGRLAFDGTPTQLVDMDQAPTQAVFDVDQPEAVVNTWLGQFDFVTGHSQEALGSGFYRYHIEGVQPQQMEQIFAALRNEDWRVRQVGLAPPSVTRVFRQLTEVSGHVV